MSHQELTPEQHKRIIELVQLAHIAINHPVKSGPKWTTYEARRPRIALDSLWEAHLLLTGSHIKPDETMTEERTTYEAGRPHSALDALSKARLLLNCGHINADETMTEGK